MAVTLPPCGELFERKYRLESVLGEGGFARVYRATEVDLGRAVALKILKPQQGAYDDRAAQRFMREVRMVARLNDPHVVTVLDYGRTPEGLLYTVFELVGGRDLAALLAERGTLDEATTVRILVQVLRALGAAHEAGLLHRDVKPDNIRVYEYMGDPLRVKLIDFGIALTDDRDASLTETGKAVGTPRFMSPEQLYGRPLGPYTDIYSLGLVAYEMLVGRPADHIRLLVQKERVALPPDVSVSAPLRRTIDRMLEREGADRYQSAAEVIAKLEELYRGSLSTEKTHQAVPLLTAPAPPVAVTSPPPQAVPVERKWLMPAVAGVGLVAVVAVAALLLMPRSESTSTSPQLPRALITNRAANPLDGVVVTAIDTGADARRPDAGNIAEAATGCGAPPPFEGTDVMYSGAGLRDVQWAVHVPKGYDSGREYPAVVLFHDDASSPAHVLAATRIADKADAEGFVVIAPRDKALGYVWHDAGVVADAVVAVDVTRRQLCIDPARIYLVGFGSGTVGADTLSCQPWVAGIALVSQIPEQPRWTCEPARAVPTLLVLPTETTFLPVEGGTDCLGNPKVSFDKYESMWRERNDCSKKQRPALGRGKEGCNAYECKGGELVSCRVAGGRNWFGAPLRKIDLLACDGPPSNFPHNDAVWEFFASLAP